MNDNFKLRNIDRLAREKYKLNLEIPKPNQVTFGTRNQGAMVQIYGMRYPTIQKLQKT